MHGLGEPRVPAFVVWVPGKPADFACAEASRSVTGPESLEVSQEFRTTRSPSIMKKKREADIRRGCAICTAPHLGRFGNGVLLNP